MEGLKQFRVIGPPGCGKTTYLSRQLANAVSAYGASSVAVISLTRTSAARVVEKAQQDGVQIAADNIGTLHSFAFHAVGARKIADKELGRWNEFAATNGGASGNLQLTAGLDEDVVRRSGQTYGDFCYENMMLLRARMIPIEQWDQPTRRFAELWEQFKRETQTVDFTDLLEMCLRDVDCCPGDPAALFVDESQDFSKLGWSLVRKWGEKCIRFVTVGDPDQLLYGWAGSDVNAFFDPPLPDSQLRVLAQSFRVPRAVHAAAVRWIERTPGRMKIDYHPTDTVGAVERGPWNSRRPESMLPTIERLAGDGKSVAIVASAAYMLMPTIKVLKDNGVPFHNPYAAERGEFNPISRANGVTAAMRVDSFLRVAGGAIWTLEDVRRWIEWLDAKSALNRGCKAKIDAWIEQHGDRQMVDRVEDIFAFDELLSLMPRESWERAIAGDLEWYVANVLPKHGPKLAYPANIVKRRGVAGLSDQPRVILSTIHAIKGGEADVCILFPDLSPAAMKEWNGGDGSAGREEIRRAYYVGMTRPKETLYLCDGSSPFSVRWN